jgi:hypothetical protein
MNSLRAVSFASLVAALLLIPQASSAAAAPAASVRLVDDGVARYSIYHAAEAPTSVRRAAAELQRVLKRMTGAELPLVTEPTERMISLGANEASRRAGITLAPEAADDSFAILTVAGSIYIVGQDSPDTPAPSFGWASRGTLYGTSEFLETLGVRWLLPGERGEDVPTRKTLDVPPLEIRQAPAFFARTLQDIQDRRPPEDKGPNEAKLWLEHQRLTSIYDGQKLSAGHSWDDYITPEQAAAHPEWLAKDAAGKPRMFSKHNAIKFCTREPALLDAFVAGVNRTLAARPGMRCASISASDGADFCACSKCAPSITRDPHGRPSYSTLMLEFYDAVARRVAEKHPDRLVCGLVYYNYQYPPPAPHKPLSKNLWLSWASLNYYGWGLAKPVYRDEFDRVAAGWRAVTPNMSLSSYSTWMRSYNGAPLPPSSAILKQELPGAHAAGFRGATVMGLGAWGYGGPTNYILAKQLWNPKVDVEALRREWLERAYGRGWPAMEKLYQLIESRLTARKDKESPVYRGQNYEVNYEVLADVYAPIFADLERLYLETMSQTTEPQRKRLEMFGENLIRLHHDLRAAGLLAGDAEKSTFHRDPDAYKKFLADTEFSYAQYRDQRSRYAVPIWKGEFRGE